MAGEFLPEKIEVNGEGHAAFRVSRLGDDLREQVGAPLDVASGEVGGMQSALLHHAPPTSERRSYGLDLSVWRAFTEHLPDVDALRVVREVFVEEHDT